VMALVLVLVPILLPEHRGLTTRRLDIVSALLSIAAVLPTVYGLKQIAADGADVSSVLAVGTGVVVATVFVRRQRTLNDPFVDLSLFASRPFAVAAGTLAIGIFVLWASNYAIAQYLQLVRGLSPLDAGLWTAPSAVGVIVGSTVAPRLARFIDPNHVIGAGLVVSAAGYAVLSRADGLALVVFGAIVVSAGLGPMMALAIDRIVGSVPPDRAGAAAAISTTAPQLGGALGIAMLGSVITVVYRQRTRASADDGAVRDAVAGRGDAADAFEDNLSAAAAAAEGLPEPLAAIVLDAARVAFTAGFHLAAAISAVLMIGTAALVVLRGRA
jgi:MFS transporter, DHA2 family, multidrug resistance protein